MEKEMDSDRTKVAQFFSDNCRNTTKVVFKISYTGTDGNIDIDKRFQAFCYQYANNEYLAGIGKLLDAYEMYSDRTAMENYLKFLEKRIILLEEKISEKSEPKEEKKEVINTF